MRDELAPPSGWTSGRLRREGGNINPGAGMEFGVDVLGIVAPTVPGPDRASLRHAESMASAFEEEEDLFEVDVIGEGGELSPLDRGSRADVAGAARRGVVGGGPPSSSSSPTKGLRVGDMPGRCGGRAATEGSFGNYLRLVMRACRFFERRWRSCDSSSTLEVAVHVPDWLMAPTGKLDGEQRSEILSHHRDVGDMLGIFETREEADGRAARSRVVDVVGAVVGRRWQELRERLQANCA